MILSFYFFLSWFFIGMLFMLPKRLPIQHLAFVFLFVDFVSQNVSYLLADPFHFYTLTKDASRYVSFSLYEMLIIPALLALIMNVYVLQHATHKKIALLLLSVCVFAALDFLSRYLNLITYKGMWQFPTLVGYRLLMFTLTFFARQGFERMCKK